MGCAMGFRFNRRVRLLPGLRLNFGKTGVSTSIGTRGAWLTFGKRGTRATVGLPGTGMSYTTTVTPGTTPTRSPSSTRVPTWLWVAGVLFFAWVVGQIHH
jgi:Protein of unknown function (DUF4236)